MGGWMGEMEKEEEGELTYDNFILDLNVKTPQSPAETWDVNQAEFDLFSDQDITL